jgi:hypothetical protein
LFRLYEKKEKAYNRAKEQLTRLEVNKLKRPVGNVDNFNVVIYNFIHNQSENKYDNCCFLVFQESLCCCQTQVLETNFCQRKQSGWQLLLEDDAT